MPIILGSTTPTSALIRDGAGARGIGVGDQVGDQVGPTADGAIAAGGGDNSASLGVRNIQARNVCNGGVNDGGRARQ